MSHCGSRKKYAANRKSPRLLYRMSDTEAKMHPPVQLVLPMTTPHTLVSPASEFFRRIATVLVACLFIPIISVRADEAARTQVTGLRVFSAGHSFHYWLPPIFKEVAASAKVAGHEQIGLQSIGGSQVIQHWNLPDGKNTVKFALETGKVQVLTLSPIYLPDEGIEKLAKLGLEHNPDIRVTVQEFWLPFDDVAAWKTRPKEVDRDSKTIADLRQAHADYFHDMDEHIGALNKQFGKTVISIVPMGQAVLALREKIIKGEVPGVKKQSELFTDPIGHPQAHLKALSAYCHLAVIYRVNPIGLPVPSVIAKLPEAEKLNRLLQEIAWDAVTSHPLSGVKK